MAKGHFELYCDTGLILSGLATDVKNLVPVLDPNDEGEGVRWVMGSRTALSSPEWNKLRAPTTWPFKKELIVSDDILTLSPGMANKQINAYVIMCV